MVAFPNGSFAIVLQDKLLEYWGYRIGHYVLLSFMDDPAWLALMFC
jgi:hypothetical protein